MATKARNLVFTAGVVGGAVGVGLAVRTLTGSRLAGWIAGGSTAVVGGALRWQLQRWFTEEPAYEVEQRIGELEIRRYAPRVEARTVLDGSFDRALDDGFSRLARYIFGGNSGREKLAMTAPVRSEGEKIAMTAPVTTSGEDGRHAVAFVMPAGRSIEDLPQPADSNVELVEVPSTRVVVLRYRGRYRGRVVAREAQRLRELVRDAGLSTSGEPVFAGYDPPWTLPPLRRNELWLPLI